MAYFWGGCGGNVDAGFGEAIMKNDDYTVMESLYLVGAALAVGMGFVKYLSFADNLLEALLAFVGACIFAFTSWIQVGILLMLALVDIAERL